MISPEKRVAAVPAVQPAVVVYWLGRWWGGGVGEGESWLRRVVGEVRLDGAWSSVCAETRKNVRPSPAFSPAPLPLLLKGKKKCRDEEKCLVGWALRWVSKLYLMA